MLGDLWSDADFIDIYTRRQAIEDGVLVQLSGPGYQGDPWVPAMVAEAGFRYPVAMTATVFCRAACSARPSATSRWRATRGTSCWSRSWN